MTWAAQEVARLPHEQVDALKIRSGEHLAAILLTAFIFAPPVGVDIGGGVDLLFEAPADRHLMDEVPPGQRIAIEVKSARGGFREFERHHEVRSGAQHNVSVTMAADVFRESEAMIEKARKLLALDVAARHVFLIVHPFDQLAIEAVHSGLIAAQLPPPVLPAGLDALWVLWVPDQLAVWSMASEHWTQMMFDCFDPDEPPEVESNLSFLQCVEADFLALIGYEDKSPYLFSFAGQDGD